MHIYEICVLLQAITEAGGSLPGENTKKKLSINTRW